MGSSSVSREIFKGKELKNSSIQFLDYKGYHNIKRHLKDDKDYIVKITDTEDSEGWCHTYYTIEGEVLELELMIQEREFEEAVKKEIQKREDEYYEKRIEEYKNMPHDVLVEKIIALEKDIKSAISRATFNYKCR